MDCGRTPRVRASKTDLMLPSGTRISRCRLEDHEAASKMVYRVMRTLMTFVLSVTFCLGIVAADGELRDVVIDERFATLDDWEDLVFSNIDHMTEYSVIGIDDACAEPGSSPNRPNDHRGTALFIESDDGGSGIVHGVEIDAYDHPIVEWRWRVESNIDTGDPLTREGDMFPVRVYVNFAYDPRRASFGTRVQYGVIRALYGEYPPHGSLVYVWANREEPATWYPNPYTARAMMYPADRGGNDVGQWKVHRRNIIDDYRAAFGEDPPRTAQLAVMGDAYGSGETSRAWIDFIRVGRK
ncbi:MAG: DUF3047 domain-containing protein [Spirochaetaceae bacterium]|nr:MAG: DUF3047 domain-containing protein [Spirochaetaceae bacterium]